MFDLLRKIILAFDADRWITVKPNGQANKGQPALIGEGGEIKGGMGGKFKGKKISDVGKAKKKPSSSITSPSSPKQYNKTTKSNIAQRKQKETSIPSSLSSGGQNNLSPFSNPTTGNAVHQSLRIQPTKEEAQGMRHYTNNGYKGVNSNLREGKPVIGKDAKTMRALDSLLERSRLQGSAIAYRGLHMKTNDLKNLNPGSTFTERGFCSVTTDPNVAKSYSEKANDKGFGREKVFMEVRIPKGTRAITLEGYTHYKGEKEVLINKGTKFKVIDNQPVFENRKQGNRIIRVMGTRRLIVEVIPDDATNDKAINPDRITFDRASQRRIDENGFLHVSCCHISKETVNEYYGSEIPGWQELGLEANKIYKGYRSGTELAKAASTFNGLPLLNEHVKDSADDPQKDLRVGNLGTAAIFKAPYLNNSLIIQDAKAIEALNPSNLDKAPKRELSASYRYDPVFKAGTFKGQRYDFIMTNIRGNHVALVEEGRAGSDVVVSDAKTIKPRGKKMDLKDMLEKLLSALGGGSTPPPGEDEGTANLAENTTEEDDLDAKDSDGDFADKLMAHVDSLEDQELAAKLKELIEAVKSAGLSTDEDPEAEEERANDTEEEEKKDEGAMDARKIRKTAVRKGKNGTIYNFSLPLAMDEKAIAARVEAGINAKVLAAREVRPLIGDLDPMAFDSAAGIYQKALELIGKGSKTKDTQALKELCAFACDAKRSNAQYPVLSAVFASDSKGAADPNFANLGKIRQA